MCPACAATAVLFATGATSTGGLAAWLLKWFRPKPSAGDSTRNQASKEKLK